MLGIVVAIVWALLPVYPYLISKNHTDEYHSHLQSIYLFIIIYASCNILGQLVFHEELFAKIFLPVIIFEAGWSLTGHSRTVFLHSFFQISSLAIIGIYRN